MNLYLKILSLLLLFPLLSFSDYNCGPNEHYSPCGPNYENEEGGCIEGCFCNEGYIKFNGECVPIVSLKTSPSAYSLINPPLSTLDFTFSSGQTIKLKINNNNILGVTLNLRTTQANRLIFAGAILPLSSKIKDDWRFGCTLCSFGYNAVTGSSAALITFQKI